MKKLLITLATTFLIVSSINAKTLVAYFSFPINNGKESLDASSGASVVPDTNGEGNAEFIAKTVARTLGRDADLFEIDIGNHYPRDYRKLFEVVPAEQRKDIRPALLQRVKDISEYDKIAIITPIWYYRMPLAVVGKIVNVLADEKVLSENGKVDPLKLNALIFDQFQNGYYVATEKAGQAWNAGREIMKAAQK